MDKKILKNYFYNILYQLFVVITPFITVPYITRTLGLDAQGISDWTSGLVQWFVLFGILGVNIYGNKKIAEVRDDKELMSKTFFEIFVMQFICMTISAICYLGFIQTLDVDVRFFAFLQVISLFSVSLDVTWFFYGVEDFKKASIRNMIIKVLGIVLIFSFVKSPADLGLFIIINAGSGVLGQAIMWVQLRHYIKFQKVTKKGVMQHLKPNILLFVPQIATSIYTMLDVSMLGYLYHDIGHVSLYQQAQRFIKMFLFFITSIGAVMLPRIANMNTRGEEAKEEITRFLQTTLRMALYLAIPMIVGIITLIPSFIVWFLPPSYALVTPLIICTTPIILFISLSNVYGTQYLLPIGMTKEYTRSVVAGAITNAVINFLLMPKFGAFGAIAGSVIAEFVVTFIQWLTIKDRIDLKIRFKNIYKYIISSIAMGLVVYFVCNTLTPNILSNFVAIGSGCVVYFALLTVLKDDFHINLLNKVLKRGK
jgi:O-antigen/teichoic acid export membrane protein